MPPLVIGPIDFGPWRSNEHAPVITKTCANSRKYRLARQMLKHNRGVHQTSIEEDPRALPLARCFIVRTGLRDDMAKERDLVDPGQRPALGAQLLLDNPPARLLDRCVPAPTELLDQRRFSAAGTSRDYYEPVYGNAFLPFVEL